MAYYMFSPRDVGGWICLQCGSYKTAWRRLKCWRDEGVWDRIFKALASIRGHGMVSVDSATVEAKKGGACRI
jgi:transposase